MLSYKIKTTNRGHRKKTLTGEDRTNIYVYIETDLKKEVMAYCKGKNIAVSQFIRTLIKKELKAKDNGQTNQK